MNLPGFTAEAALYAAREAQHVAVDFAPAGRDVQPAAIAFPLASAKDFVRCGARGSWKRTKWCNNNGCIIQRVVRCSDGSGYIETDFARY